MIPARFPPGAIATATARRSRTVVALRAAAVFGVMLIGAPLLSLLWIAVTGDLTPVRHIFSVVLPAAVADTALLLAGVGVVTVLLGVGSAWLVTAFRFPGRSLLSVALVLPLAVPTYIIAYVYVEILEPLGPVQGAIRALFGFRSRADYWFPEIRSMPGAILLLGCVLYPYVYLPVRALFSVQCASLIEAGRTLGASPASVFRRIALPLARPAVALGLSLALLETLNDIGATDHLGVRTLTVAVYTTWLNRGSLPGASVLALVLLTAVTLLILIEMRSRGARSFALSAKKPRPQEPVALEGPKALLAALACALPPIAGFLVPAVFLATEAARRGTRIDPGLPGQIGATLTFALTATVLIVIIGASIAAAVRILRHPAALWSARIAGLGYALPGTVVAVALLAPIAAIDNLLADLQNAITGGRAGLLLTGTGLAVVIAYAVRFSGIAVGGVENGFARLSPHVDDAARTLGHGPGKLLRDIHWPLLRPALASSALLVFVDAMKELPATLLLRPLNVETLATAVYAHAGRGVFEDGALASLLIVAAGLAPVVLLMRASGETTAELSADAAARNEAEPTPARS